MPVDPSKCGNGCGCGAVEPYQCAKVLAANKPRADRLARMPRVRPMPAPAVLTHPFILCPSCDRYEVIQSDDYLCESCRAKI